MLPLSRHFSCTCHQVHPRPQFQWRIPGSSARALGRGSSAAPSHREQHLQWFPRKPLHPSTGYWEGLSPLLQAQHTPRSPSLRSSCWWAHAETPQPGEGAPCWYKLDETLGEHPSEESCSGLPPGQPSALPSHSPASSSVRLSPEPQFCCCPGWEQHPQCPLATQVTEVFSHQPLEVSNQQCWGSAVAAATGKKK